MDFSAGIGWGMGVGDMVLHESLFSQEYQGINLAKVSSRRKGNENRRVKVDVSASIVWGVGVGDCLLHESHFSQEYGQQRVKGINLAKVSSERKGNENRRVKVDFSASIGWGVGVEDIVSYMKPTSARSTDNRTSRASILQR